MNSKVRYLMGNIGWMTISNFASKVLVFLMVPFYTRVLSTQDYGLYDLGYTTALLIAPLITLNTGESIMRYIIVDTKNTNRYFSTALTISILACIVSQAALPVLSNSLELTPEVTMVVTGCCLIIPSNTIYLVFSQFARGIDKVKEMAIGGFINSLLLVTLSALFVLYFNLSVMGCFYGASLSMLIASLYISLRCKFWRYITLPDMESAKKLVAYGMPLSVNSLGWWANSSLSRYVTALMLGVASSGLLAAAYKVPAIPKAIQQIFIQAWQISSIRDFDPDDSDHFFSNTYSLVGVLSAILTSLIIISMPILANILFAGDFIEAWHYVPLLMICIVFDCLASIIGGVFSAVGDTKPIAVSAALSVVATVITSVIGIRLWGIQGACAASAISSAVIWISRLVACKKYIRLQMDWKLFAEVGFILSIQIYISLILDVNWLWYLLQSLCILAIFLIALMRFNLKVLLNGLFQKK